MIFNIGKGEVGYRVSGKENGVYEIIYFLETIFIVH